MTAEERAHFEAFKAQQAKAEAKQKAKDDRDAYRELVDETIAKTIPMLTGISSNLREIKNSVIKEFRQVMDMKADVMKLVKENQRSNTFTNTEGTMRVCVGYHTTDAYRDTVEDGIAIVREYISGLAKDDKTQALVQMVLRLLARDAKGTLKASRVLQLRQVAEEIGDERFLEGVTIIVESYQPTISRQFIRAEVKNDSGAWVNVPLGMTEA